MRKRRSSCRRAIAVRCLHRPRPPVFAKAQKATDGRGQVAFSRRFSWALSRLLRWFCIILAAIGVFLGTIPDSFPEAVRALPPVHTYQLGFAKLGETAETDSDGNAIGVLRRVDPGHRQIYGLLRLIDPSIPPLASVRHAFSGPLIGAIVATKEIGWNTSTGQLPVFQPVQVVLPDGKLKPVCTIPE